MALKDITITGSIGTYPTLSYGQKMYVSSTDEESFPIEEAVGSNGGSMPNLFGQTSSVDLYVNIDQKWSGYNDTQAGLVAYTQSFQSEFINGELSGSVLTVSNGELTDPDCRQFLEVNTTEVNYDIFVYYSYQSTNFLYANSPYLRDGNFVNPDVAPKNGEIFILNSGFNDPFNPPYYYLYTPQTVNYIKISRFDKQGNDNTLSLQELTKLVVKFSGPLTYSTVDIVDFPLFTISEYPTYYLYTTYYINSSNIQIPFITTDNNVIMHQFEASAGVYYIPSTSTYNGNTLIASIDNNSCFNQPTGLYTFNDTPNIEILYTASFRAVNSFVGSMVLYGDTSFVSSSTSFTSGSDYMITGSIYPIINQQYTFKVKNTGGTGASITNISFILTQSVAPHTTSNLTVLEPYLTQNFEYDDCNALYGNALNLEYDSAFYQVNYEGTTVPTNQQQILNRTAELAPVKSYNYTAAAQVLPRYKGSRLTSDAYNTGSVVTASLIQSSYPQYLNAKSYGYIPVSTYDTAIFEFNGGNPTVEVSKTSRIDISNILNIDNTSSVSTIYSSDSAFAEIIENKIQLKTTPIITQYTTNEIVVPADVKVVTNDISPTPVFMNTSYPQDWTYISGSQQDNTTPAKFMYTGSYYKIDNYIDGDDFKNVAYVLEGTINTDGCIFLIPTWLTQAFVDGNVTWTQGSQLSRIKADTYVFLIGNAPNQVDIFERSWYVYKDSNGDYYPKGSVTTQVISQSIADGINKGERWFISIYDTLFTAPVNINTVTPLINTFTSSLDAINYPLAYSSAYEIDSFSVPYGDILEFLFKPPVGTIGNIFQGPPGVLYGGNNIKYGLLIWKSPAVTNTILFNGTNLVNLGLGNIITNNSSPTIKNNLNLISKTFGSKP
jgi:hypothetical protein